MAPIPRTTVYIATSLDGFIARTNGDIDWLPQDADIAADGDHGYEALMESVDALVMGRHTFEKVLTFGGWHYGEKPVVVLGTQPVPIPSRLPSTVEWMSGTPTDIVTRLAARGHHHLYIDGGVTIQRFLEAGLIQRLIITRIPILIGRGIPLFGPLDEDIRLHHIQTRSFPSGLVQSEYEVPHSNSPP